MLTFEEIEDCFPEGEYSIEDDGPCTMSAQWLHDFARAIENKATVELRAENLSLRIELEIFIEAVQLNQTRAKA